MAGQRKRPVILMILDGWGIGPKDNTNAIYRARTPNYDSYIRGFPHSELEASSVHVGLPQGQDGNSEAGHMNIGAGRIVEQDSIMISRAISDGTFFKNPALIQTVKHANKHKSRVHLMGLLSGGQSAHSNPDHLIALISFFQYQTKMIYLHLFTDGRDSHRYSAIKLLRKSSTYINTRCSIATIAGRAYAMDRKKDWSNTKLAYDAMVMGRARYTMTSPEDAILKAYNRGETDEFITPTVIVANDKPVARIENKDVVVFFNLRSDRARQLTKPFVQSDFEHLNKNAFKRSKILRGLFFLAMTDFGPDLGGTLTAFPSRDITETLPFALKNYRQMYIAESEKYAHITYFFNGGYDHPVAGEDRMIVASPKTLSYVSRPRMALGAVTNRVLRAVAGNQYDFIALNVSNPDMLAHTGDMQATVKAIEYTDSSMGQIVRAVQRAGGIVCVTGDHGNAEEMVHKRSGEIDTEHSKNRVPFIIIQRNAGFRLRRRGVLGDVAPTILDLMKISKPAAMTGKSLITH